MTKRILFVDDEPFILEALKRGLRGMRHEWEMAFVTSASAALDELRQERFDAVVTDMRMPGMDGAEFLENVQKEYPNTVRIVLSGQCDNILVPGSMDPTHQLLLKPCDVEELKRRLSLAFSMQDLIKNPAMGTAITRLRAIPSQPHAYSELMSALRSSNTSLSQIEEIISQDAALATKTLQLANSAFIGASGQVSSLQKAVSLIGTDALRTVAFTLQVFSQFGENTKAARYLPRLWDHCLDVGYLARQIALNGGCSAALVEQSATAAVIHDAGIAVLLTEKSEEYVSAFCVEGERPPQISLERERELFGCTHAEVGAYLMSIWGLPPSLVYTVAFHHSPSNDLNHEFSALTAVYFAESIVNCDAPNAVEHCDDIDHEYLERFNLTAEIPAWKKIYENYKETTGKRVTCELQASFCRR